MLVTVSFSLESVLQQQCRGPKTQAREKRCENDSIAIRTATMAGPYLYNKRCIRSSWRRAVVGDQWNVRAYV